MAAARVIYAGLKSIVSCVGFDYWVDSRGKCTSDPGSSNLVVGVTFRSPFFETAIFQVPKLVSVAICGPNGPRPDLLAYMANWDWCGLYVIPSPIN